MAGPPARTMSPATGHSRHASSDLPPFGRSRTPDRTPFSKPPIPSADPPHFGSGRALPPHGQTSPDERSLAAPARPQSVSHFGDNRHPTQSSPPGSSVEPTPGYNHDRRMSLGSGPLPRPSSQPHFDDTSSNNRIRTSIFGSGSAVTNPSTSGYRDGAHNAPSSQQRATPAYHGPEHPGQAQPPRFGGPGGRSDMDGARYEQEQQQQRRSQEYATPIPSESRYQQGPQDRFGSEVAGPKAEAERSQHRASWDAGFQRHSPETARTASSANNESSSSNTFGFGAIQNYTKSLGSQPPAPRSVPGGPAIQSRQDHTPSSDISPAAHRSLSSRPYSPTPRSQPSFQHASEEQHQQQPRGTGGEPLQHKNVLHVNSENKREGRASPLPQAVQGAQAPLLGPPGEAGLKNELGRVFSGIGSGVGASATGTVGGSGSSTPMPSSSPFKPVSARTEATDGDIGGLGKPVRTGSGTKRSRKTKVDDGKAEDDGSSVQRDGLWAQGTPARRGGRPAHHHHHHHPHQYDIATRSTLFIQ